MLTLLSLFLAAAPVGTGANPTVLGWSKDGESVVWTYTEQAYGPKKDDPEDMEVTETAKLAGVLDVREGTTTRYVLSVKKMRRDANALATRLAGLSSAADFEAWKKARRVVATKSSSGASGAATDVLVNGESRSSWSADENPKVTLVATKGTDKSSLTFEDGMGAMFVPQRSVEVWWDPTGRRVLFAVITAAATTMRGGVDPSAELYVLPVPPRVEIVAPARLTDESSRVAGVVEQKGFAVVSVGVAQKERTATVIYAGAAYREAARKLAAAFPGATVEPLTWKANGEMVVAVGAPEK